MALKRFKRESSKYKYLEIGNPEIKEVKKYPTVGRPQKGKSPLTTGYQVRRYFACSLKHKEAMENSKGYFVLSTNDLNSKFSANEILSTYTSQQSVERGFRFLKSPDFLVSSFFLTKLERIESLLMVMTLCLLV